MLSEKNFFFHILALLWPMLALFSGKKCPQCQMVIADPDVFAKSSKLNQGLAFLPIAQATASRWMLINFEWSSWVPYLLLIQLLWGEQCGNFTYRLWRYTQSWRGRVQWGLSNLHDQKVKEIKLYKAGVTTTGKAKSINVQCRKWYCSERSFREWSELFQRRGSWKEGITRKHHYLQGCLKSSLK